MRPSSQVKVARDGTKHGNCNKDSNLISLHTVLSCFGDKFNVLMFICYMSKGQLY